MSTENKFEKQRAENEVDLRDLISALWYKRIFIAVSTTVMVVLGIAFSIVTKPDPVREYSAEILLPEVSADIFDLKNEKMDSPDFAGMMEKELKGKAFIKLVKSGGNPEINALSVTFQGKDTAALKKNSAERLAFAVESVNEAVRYDLQEKREKRAQNLLKKDMLFYNFRVQNDPDMTIEEQITTLTAIAESAKNAMAVGNVPEIRIGEKVSVTSLPVRSHTAVNAAACAVLGAFISCSWIIFRKL